MNTTIYPKGSSEAIIQEKLTSLINEIKEIMYTPDYKRSQEFKSRSCNLTVLGVIISKFCEWDISEIEQVAEAALQDSNYYFRFAKVDELELELKAAKDKIKRLENSLD